MEIPPLRREIKQLTTKNENGVYFGSAEGIRVLEITAKTYWKWLLERVEASFVNMAK